MAISKKQATLFTVKANESIGTCVRLLREHSVGALLVMSEKGPKKIVGIFTERDLVKNLELIQEGSLWLDPVRTLMTPDVRTITAENISDAPRIMAEHKIRHLPIVHEDKGEQRVVGVISMRDVFRMVMQKFDYDLTKVLASEKIGNPSSEKLVGIFTRDAEVREVIEKGSRFNSLLLMEGVSENQSFDDLKALLEKFSAIFIDLDDLSDLKIGKILTQSRKIKKNKSLFLSFSVPRLSEDSILALHLLAENESVHLVPKPIAVGFLYEKFFKLVG